MSRSGDALAGRRAKGARARRALYLATGVGLLALLLLLASVANRAMGLVVLEDRVAPRSLTAGGTPLHDLDREELTVILEEHLSAGLLRRLDRDRPLEERSRSDLLLLVEERVVRPSIVSAHTLVESVTRGSAIRDEAAKRPGARVVWRSWVSEEFLTSSQSSDPGKAGVRTAILGTVWTILITVALALPLGVGTAVWLEEFAEDTPLTRVVQTNINNLAGVPSIVYGMLGLAVFVRFMKPFTSGIAFGAADATSATGRTILSAAMTLALLVLPIVIINAQEAIRAVPRSLREASLAMGATRWQTVRHHVLPNALQGILTGSILAMSRAVGETAPLVVIGASTFIAVDPEGPFSRFTTLPVQIYQWTARPQPEFRHLAAAAILVLLFLLLTLNATAVWLRHRAARK